MWVFGAVIIVGVVYLAVMLGYALHHNPATSPSPTTSTSAPPAPTREATPPSSEAPAPPSTTAPLRPFDPVATAEQERTICGWLRDSSWTNPQIESSTGDMLANAGWSYTKADLQRVIQGAMTNTCPDVHRSF